MTTVLITGASSGIGAAIARALAGRHQLILVARRREQLEALARSLHATALVADLATSDGVSALAAALPSELHAVINNAGVFEQAAGDAIDAAHLERIWRINVAAPMLLTAALLPRLRSGGSVITISSAAVEQSFPGCAAYTASKCAIEGWSRVLREELRPRGIRVGVIAPGATDTAIWPNPLPDATRARLVRPDDVAAAVRLMIEAPAATSIDRITVTPSGGPV